MVWLFYNKLLLRVLAVLTGLGIGVASYSYISLSAQKLPGQGWRDALAIVSFLIAGWLTMLIAEVVDNHYVRAFGCLCVGLGGYLSYPWMFITDGPKLAELPDGPQGMRLAAAAFWAAMTIAAALLVILVTRLVLDRLTYGRRPAVVARADVSLGVAPVGAGQPEAAPDLPPIPVDISPLPVATGAAPVAAVPPQPVRNPGPVKQLTGIGGMYLGTVFELTPGTFSIGRADADLLLGDDKQVSRQHAQLEVGADGQTTLRDTGSTNGTLVNHQRVESIQLAAGDIVQVGTTLFKVEA